MTALELLRRERSALIECNSVCDRETHEPIPGTMDAGAIEAVAEYDAAIAEVEGMVAALDAAETMLRCGPDITTNAMGTKPTMTTRRALEIVRAAIPFNQQGVRT